MDKIMLFSVSAPDKDFGIGDLEVKINPTCTHLANEKKLRKAFRNIFKLVLDNIALNMEESKNEN